MPLDEEKEAPADTKLDPEPASPQQSQSERRRLGRMRGVPRGGKAGYAGEDSTWSRDRLSRHHIISAHHFAESAEAIEDSDSDDIPQEEKWRYRAYVTASVLSAAAFLQASINELYLELQKLSESGQPQLRRELAELVRVWPQIVRAPVLQKYQHALSVADADQYNETRMPYVDADSLVRLRDALLSYQAEWDDSRGKHQTLEKRLAKKFPPSPLVSSQRPWFPDRCLGAGCAKWAVQTVQVFTNDFYQRMALPGRPLVGGEGPA
ncbi:MAG: hypothetical protein ABI681_10560 [Gemmatimonadales bacterium]